MARRQHIQKAQMLTEQQKEFAQAWASPDNNETSVTDLCKKVGISRVTYYKWLCIDEFVQYCNKLTDAYAMEIGADAWRALHEQIKKGNVQAIRLYYELMARVNTSGNQTIINIIAPGSEESPEKPAEKLYIDGNGRELPSAGGGSESITIDTGD